MAIVLIGMACGVTAAQADEDSDKLLGDVLSGLLGQPQGAAYTQQEKDRLVSLLQGGDYVTSRQGEPVDLIVFGVPLTRTDHVYTANPVPPSQTYRSDQPR